MSSALMVRQGLHEGRPETLGEVNWWTDKASLLAVLKAAKCRLAHLG